MTTQKSIGPAVGILMLVGIAAFVATTLAVSSASTDFAAKSGPSIEQRRVHPRAGRPRHREPEGQDP